MKKFALTIALSAGLSASAFGNFAKAITFTTSGYQGSAALENFPVLVRLSNAIEGFDYVDFGAETNMVFKDAGGNAIPHEIDTWDAEGTSLVWVRVPSVTAATTFTMFYCGSEAVANNPSTTWAGANYVGVWHMDEVDGTVADATGHGLTATPTPAGGASASLRYAGADAPVGRARQTGTSATKCYLSVPNYDSFNVGSTFTISGWVRLTENVGNNPRLFSRKDSYNSNNGWEIEMATASSVNFQVRGAARDKDQCKGGFNPSLQNRWTHVALVYDGSTCTVYSNGYGLVTGTITPATDNGLPLSIGCDSDGSEANVRGAFDECRLMNAAASADWIAAEYATVADSAFLTAGAVAGLAPTLGEVTVTPSSDKAVISGTIASPGAASTACDVYLALGLSADALGAATKIASAATDSFAYTIRNLSAKTTYFYELFVTNNAIPAMGAAMSGSFMTEAPFDFSRKITFTVACTNGNGLSGIPVLVRLSADSPSGFAYRDCAPGGSDVRFTDAEGRAIPFEIDTWDPSGESLVWVKVPSVAQGTTFTMFYKGTPGTANDPREVWTDYTGVWHLNGLGADATPFSQGLYPNSTATTGIDGHLSTNSIAGEDGRFGKAFRVNDSPGWKQGNFNEGGVWVEDAGENSPLDPDGVFTISGWFKHADWNYNYGHIFFKRLKSDNTDTPDGSFAIQLGSNSWDNHIDARGSSNTRVRATTDFSLKNVWIYLTVVYNGKNCTVYVNGAPVNSYAYMTAVTDNNAPLVFGNNVAIASGGTGDCAWSGLIDEVRYLRAAKSADWIAAEYAAMGGDAFVTAGEVEKIGRRLIITVQ